MKIQENVKENVWETVYNMDGFGLSDWLNDFNRTKKYNSTQHGERVWTEGGFEFNDWPEWREKCSYFYGGLIDTIESLRIRPTEDDIIALLVHGICVSLNLLKDNARKPKYRSRFLFM